MTLDRFEPTSPIAAPSREARHDGSAAELFAQSALYELRQSAFGIGSNRGTAGPGAGKMEQPMDAESLGQSATADVRDAGLVALSPQAGAALVSRYRRRQGS